MTEIQAALGISQMKRLNQYVQRRHELASRYDRLLKELPLRLPKQNPDSYSAYHLYVIRLDVEKIRSSHRTVFDNLRAENIGVNLHYIPVYLHPYYQQLGFTAGLCPQAEQYAAEAISLPLYPELSEKEQDFVIKTLQQVLI
jgi:dTDP-4-amino-4,6-dideoxygalactose transaminase